LKISIIGAGAMGSLYGGKLSVTGNEVTLYDINRNHISAIQQKGLAIEDLATGSTELTRPMASTDPDSVIGSDIIIVFVKSTVTEHVARQFRNIAGEKTIICTLQNGIGNEEVLRNYFGARRTAAGVTSEGATFLSSGKVRHAGKGPTHLCMSDRQNDRIKPLVAAMNGAGFETVIEENIENLIWSKLIINVGINALTALTGLHNGRLLDFEETRELISELVAEAMDVVQAKGLTLIYEDPVETVYSVCKKTGGNRSSMLQDFDKKSRTEIDFINNAVVREGQKLGIPMPVNRTVGMLVKAYDQIHTGTDDPE